MGFSGHSVKVFLIFHLCLKQPFHGSWFARLAVPCALALGLTSQIRAHKWRGDASFSLRKSLGRTVEVWLIIEWVLRVSESGATRPGDRTASLLI
ncbi:hypothetical protein BDV19DRAFT_282151 [Aspergillus venezuelensis]